MTQIKSLDSRITFGMFFQSLGGQFQKLLASTMSAEDKMKAIIAAMEKDVQAKRVTAREIGAQMRAIADPETKALEPLESAKARRESLVALGAQNLNNKTRLGQISQEIKAVDALIESQQGTYDTLAEAYATAKANYEIALSALDSARSNGPAMIAAINAHKQALETKDKARQTQQSPDVTFIKDLTKELENAKAQARTDRELEKDLDATQPTSIDQALAKMDAESVDASLMAEFQAAAGKGKKK